MSEALARFPGRTVLSIWAWLVLGLTVLVALPVVALVWLATAWRDPGRYWAGYTFRKAAVVIAGLNPLWRFTVSGKVPADPRRPYMVVANHESFVDILLIAHLPFEMKWLAKSDFFSYPVVGWLMRMAGDIRLVRHDKASRSDGLVQMADRLGKKVSVMVFPEGTRSASGELGEFRDGAFRVAIEAGVPILPLAVIGTRDALVKHDWRFGATHAEVRVLDPIQTEPGMDVATLRETARTAIAAAVEELRREHGRG
ncbi:MAG: lysophospholipid acyltransferase family protein [Propionicimonas sp.]|nr:lysophospholipid acyltransferase family protein [Propionicimonas sp.]MEA5117261.1 lysophospholipid acyltransferase family protein [Propionicimonas sp.]